MTQKNDYSWVTDEMFDRKLNEIAMEDLFGEAPHPIKMERTLWENILEKNVIQTLRSIAPSAYEELKEHYNNEVLKDLEAERPPMTAQEFFDGNLEGCPICHDHLAQLEAMEIEKKENTVTINIVSITYTCPKCDEEFVFEMECKPIKIEH